MSKAQGQFTIIDYNDALTLTGYIGSNLAKTQMYNPDNGSYTPDWKTKNLVLTPSLYVIGTTADQIATANVTSVKWYVGDSNTAITAGTNYALSGAKSHILTVKANVMAELPGIDYRCVITYKDESTGLSLTHPLTISFSRVVNGSGIVDLLVTTPNGNVFKNEEVASLTAKAELWRGSTVDTTKVSYKWAVMDASVTATSSTGYDADFGIGWRKLSDTADKYTGTATNIWQYSVNGGSSWTQFSTTAGTSASVTLSSLSPNTTYSTKVRARRQYNQVYGTSGTTNVKTLGGAVVNSVSTVTADAATVSITLNVTVYEASYTNTLAIKNGSITILTITGLSWSKGTANRTVTLTADQRTTLLNSMASMKSFTGTFAVSSFHGQLQIGSTSSKTATVQTTAANSGPTLSGFTYEDSYSTTKNLTGDNQLFVQSYSRKLPSLHRCRYR